MALRWCARATLLALAYWAGAQLGLALALDHGPITPFWPPTGIAVAALLLGGRALWPGVLVAAFAVELPLLDDVAVSAVIAVGNTLAPLAAVTLLRRAGCRAELDRLRDAGSLVGLGALAMTLSAGVGTAALAWGGLPTSEVVPVLATWWAGDTVGAVVVTPFLLSLARPLALRPGRRAAELAGLLVLTAVLTMAGFGTNLGLRFLVFPVLAVISVRFGLRGAAPAVLTTGLLAALAAARGQGLFATTGTVQAVFTLSLFDACAVFTSLLLAAVTTDRARVAGALKAQGEALEQLVEERTDELSTTLDQLAQAQHIAGMGSYDFDLRTGEARWSDELYRLMLMPVGAPMSLEVYLSLCEPSEVGMVQEVLGRTVTTGEPFTMDHRLRRADGVYRWMHCQGQVVRDADGTIVGTRGTATDVQHRKAAERRFETLVELAPDAMVFVDEGGLITQVNRQTETLFGHDRHSLVGQPIEVLIPERFRAKHAGHRAAFVRQPDLRPMGRGLDLLARRADGSEFPVEISLSPLETDEGTLVSASIRDVTDRKAQQDALAHAGLHDALTGLPNRVLLADRLGTAVARLSRDDTRAAVLFLDLDRLKWVNDSLGHDAGDTLIRAVADRLTRAARPQDTVARFGGDEFVVLCEGLSSEAEAVAMAERLRAAVSPPVDVEAGHVVVPTMSIGITTTCDPASDPAALLRDADAAMYRAKERGRDRTAVFAPDLHAEMRTRLETTGALRHAIERGQLRVHYQPVVDLGTGRPVGVEALVRWQHPQRGLLLPGEFLTLAEETGQVGALDRAVILQACREFGGLGDRSLTLNVNVSLQHLSIDRLREALERGLAEGGLGPEQLTVEVTESADLSTEQFAGLLAMVQALGAKVAIDDFGTGFSALSRLGGLAIDAIKVDRSFVTDVHTNPRRRALVAAMTQLGRALDARVIAEGIELREQARVLEQVGCSGGQGHHWSKALPLDDLSAWLRRADVPSPRSASQPTRV